MNTTQSNETRPSPFLPKMYRMVSNYLVTLVNDKGKNDSKSSAPSLMVYIRKKRQEKKELLASVDTITPRQSEAVVYLQEKMSKLSTLVGAKEMDLLFLKTLLEHPQVSALVKTQDRLEKEEIGEPVSCENLELAHEISDKCSTSHDPRAKQLSHILRKPHFKGLLEAHDTVAVVGRNGDSSVWEKVGSRSALLDHVHPTHMETLRVIGLRKNSNQPLGLTVEVREGKLVVARILAGGAIERQGLIHPGDTILEVNNQPVNSPEQLQHQVALANDSITFRVLPSPDNNSTLNTKESYMRALFDYDPRDDTLLPCKEIGLAFQRGDILQIVNQKDPNWWQAKIYGTDGPAFLIPSQELEERRKAFVKPEADYVHKIGICGTRISKKKRKIRYQSKANVEFDKAELFLYEEVARLPPFKRRTLVLVGSHGVGRRTLKNRLINSDPTKFAAVVPMTSRPPRALEENGKGYWFVGLEEMDDFIRDNKMLEYGEHNGHIYGTNLDSIRDVIAQGKMCVLDCSPAALKVLHNSSEFMPYVIFIAAPGMELLKQMYDFSRSTGSSSRNFTFDRQSSIRYSSRRARTLESLASLYEEDDLKRTVEESSLLQRTYDKYIDMIIVNEDFDETFRQVVEALETLTSEHQWVPVNWVY